MRYDGPTSLDFEQPIYNPPAKRKGLNGPLVIPGKYKVELTYEGNTVSRDITVAPDPRLNISDSHYRKHVEIAVRVRNEMDALDTMLNQLVSLQRQLKDREGAIRNNLPEVQLAGKLQSLQQKANLLQSSLLAPGIQQNVPEDSLHALMRLHGKIQRTAYMMFYSYAFLPNQSMADAMREQENQLNVSLSKYNHLIETEIPKVNHALSKAGLAPISELQTVSIARVQPLM